MRKNLRQSSLLNLSVEEESLAAIPFAVLERRVGKRIGKIELKGTKVLPDGSEIRVVWQVQGNAELGLPTEQDLDIFVALGALTFRGNFAKTVSFTGREIAKILNIGTVHGKFYQRLKLAMDRFIALRFRALAADEKQEEVKWVNVFQEASFSLDRSSGRCVGSVTWTDKLIQSMDSGFFRVLDSSRYMELDGITAKHLYRFLAVAFEKTDVVLIDPRTLAAEHLGIINPPKYLSRLMQTLEPAFDQLKRIEVLGSYTIVSSSNGRLALRRHPNYVPERKTLQLHHGGADPEMAREYCRNLLVRGGMASRPAGLYVEEAANWDDFYAIERAARLLQWMIDDDVLPHVAISLVRRALDEAGTPRRDLLDRYELCLEVCQQKKRAGQSLKNSAGLFIKMVKDEATFHRTVNDDMAASLLQNYRRREDNVRRLQNENEERSQILDYEQFRERFARQLWNDLSESKRNALWREKEEALKALDRFQRLPLEMQAREVEDALLNEIGKKETPSYERWLMRRRAEQALLPFRESEEAELACV
ncbi:MAG: replication initiator protein A [Bryobacterales bacterium]|nr:replication initiator protein A [Bryobacterales bacterium]